MLLKNLAPRLAERGKIKIGAKGAPITSRQGTTFQPPQKLDHFVVTTLERGADGNFVRDEAVHALIGDQPRRIPVRLLFNDIEMNFMSRYACFAGRQMWCAGDGETAQRMTRDGARETVQCPCPRIEQGYQGKDRCKVNGALSLIIDGIPGVGNVWTFRTTSWNSVQNLTSAMYQIKALSGGVLAGLPIDLVLAPKEVTAPDGKMMKAWIVSMQFSGTVEDLRDVGYKLLEAEATHGMRVRQIEDDVRRRLALPAPSDVPLPGDDINDIVDEFYHDEPAPPRPTREQFKALPAGNEGAGEYGPADNGGRAPVTDVMPVPAQSPAAQADEDGIAVYDAFGEVSSQHPTIEDAAKAFKEFYDQEPEASRAALCEANPDLASGAIGPAPSRTPAVDPGPADGNSTKGSDPSAPETNGSGGGAQSKWISGLDAPLKGRRWAIVRPSEQKTRYFSPQEWVEVMDLLLTDAENDPHEVWAENLTVNTELVRSATTEAFQLSLRNLADAAKKAIDETAVAMGGPGV